MEKKRRFLGKITKRFWTTPKKYLDILANSARVRELKPQKKTFLEKDKVTPEGVAEYVAKAAEKVIEFNPTALVAIHQRGVIAARLVQHYIKRKTGKTHKVYIIKPGKRGSLMSRVESAQLILPKQEAQLKKEKKIAVIDDVSHTLATCSNIEEFLEEKISIPRDDIDVFPLLKTKLYGGLLNVFSSFDTIDPLLEKKLKKIGYSKEHIEKIRHEKFSAYTICRDALDDYMNKKEIGKDTRVRTK